MGKILLGYFDKNNFITKDIGIDLKYPQGMWVKNDNLFIVETGMHSLIRYDLKNYTKTISILPKGVFRSVTGIDENQLFISGQVFFDNEYKITNNTIVTDERRSVIHKVSFEN